MVRDESDPVYVYGAVYENGDVDYEKHRMRYENEPFSLDLYGLLVVTVEDMSSWIDHDLNFRHACTLPL